MDERIAERLADESVAHDTRLLGDFTRIYCRGKHGGRSTAPLESLGTRVGVYGEGPLELCDECRALLVYAEKRRALCPQDRHGQPKPFCSHCEIHCYEPAMSELMRDVMRYAGPRAVLHGYAADSLRHLIEGRKHSAEMRRRESAGGGRGTERK